MGIYDAVVNRILELCKERKITPNALSYISGVSQSTIKSILNGESQNPGIVTLKKLCDGLEISIIQFFNTDEFKNLEQEIKQVFPQLPKGGFFVCPKLVRPCKTTNFHCP